MATLNTLAGLRSSNEASPEMPKLTRAWYNKVFLTIATPKLVHDQFGMPTTLPQGNGEQVLWRRWERLTAAAVPLLEGVNPTGKRLSYTNVLGTVYWYGDWVGITDVVDFMHPDNVLSIATKRLAQQSAETKDLVTRDVVNAGTSFLRITADGTTPTVGVGARSTVAGCITKAAVDTAITVLEAEDAEYYHGPMGASVKTSTEPIGPAFVAIVHPHVAHDFVNAASGFGTDWVPREKYASGGVAYPTEIGKYRNVRFLTSTAAKYWASTGHTANVGTTPAATYRSTNGSNGDVYSVLILAKEAFGTVKLAGATATYYNKPGGNADPLHRKATAGWKGCWGASILNDDFMVRIECLARW
jgi:N4-gp56 family major capsid protein